MQFLFKLNKTVFDLIIILPLDVMEFLIEIFTYAAVWNSTNHNYKLIIMNTPNEIVLSGLETTLFSEMTLKRLQSRPTGRI